jgi:tRNA(fMet)-specific endonuclease VapC
MILDTTFLVDVLRGEGTVAELVSDIDDAGTPYVSAITVMELYEGIHLADTTETQRDAVEDLLTEINELPFDSDCGIEAGRISAELVSAGERIDETDVMIAATALVHGHPVVTRNVDHFDRIDGVDVVSY